jgi:hypothetical protein
MSQPILPFCKIIQFNAILIVTLDLVGLIIKTIAKTIGLIADSSNFDARGTV